MTDKAKRCCAVYTSGKRCKRLREPGSSWCAKHRPTMEAYENHAKRISQEL